MKYKFTSLLIALLCSIINVYAQNEIVINGIVRDRINKNKLENVTVSVAGSSIGTVTNAEGVFSLKLSQQLSNSKLELSHIGYQNTQFAMTVPDNSSQLSATIWMTPVTQQLDEVVVYGGDARRIVKEALKKIPVNYPAHESMLNTFYRETIQKRHRYIGVSEAMMDVYKTAYTNRNTNHDKVQLIKARRLVSQKQSDTLAVKMEGGPNQSIFLDIAKNEDALLDQQSMEYYTFTQEPSVLLDNRPQYVIRFAPRVKLSYALFTGKLFIDREKLAITRAEFSLDLSDREKATRAILRKKPVGLRFRPQEVNFLVTYHERNGLTYLHYICNEMRFKCDWKRRLFSSPYTARSEMVVVEQDEQPDRIIARRNAFSPKQIFYDVVEEYWNEDYWKEYNIIEPTETLDNAVKKLKKQLSQGNN